MSDAKLTDLAASVTVSLRAAKSARREYHPVCLTALEPRICRGFSNSEGNLGTYGRAYRAAQADCPSFRKARSVVVSLYVRPPEHITFGDRFDRNLRRAV